MLFTLATLAGLGCAPSQDAAPVAPAAPREPTGSAQPTPRNDDPLRHRRELVARADQALARHWPLDYRRPFESTSHDELELERLYLEACRAGDKPSCWIAATYELWEDYRPATIRVFENCRA
ncbi:MAG TPA: hypothetical protein VFK02_21530, partial [Kofleriaceae bacterium]|nr:hypothetical protein [Kofleriaceae bacterium]